MDKRSKQIKVLGESTRCCSVDEKGFTLIEAMVAMMVFSVGVMAVLLMQARAIDDTGMASHRSGGTRLAMSLLESLHQLPFDDPLLVQTHANVAAMPQRIPDAATRQLNAANIALLPTLANLYRIGADGSTVTSISAGKEGYQLAWAVVDQVLGGGETPTKTIRVYLTWRAMQSNAAGEVRSIGDWTTTKYNNIAL